MILPVELQNELKKRLSLIRLAKTGFFKKAECENKLVQNELLLHRAVLDKALIDSFSPDDEIRTDVEEWLDLANEDFIICCENAMLDPEGVFATFKVFKKLLKGNNARFRRFGLKRDE